MQLVSFVFTGEFSSVQVKQLASKLTLLKPKPEEVIGQ